MPPFNFKAQQQFPMVAQESGYSPVASLLEMARGKPTTSSIIPIGPNPEDLLQGLGGLQSEMQNSSSRRFGIVRDRMNEALRQAEDDALKRRMEEQNRLIAEQNKLGQVQNQTPAYNPYVNTNTNITLPFTNNNNTAFPNLTDPNGLKFPDAQLPQIAQNKLPGLPQGKNMTLKQLLNMGLNPPKKTTDLNAWLQQYMANKNKTKKPKVKVPTATGHGSSNVY